MGGSRARRRRTGGGSVELSCQTFAPIATRTGGIAQVRPRAQPIRAGAELEVQPPDFHRLKCKPVSGAVRKQIENFVLLVPDRARTFSWTRCRTVGTLDAEQDPRRGHRPDTVFYICGFNTMGESRSDLCPPPTPSYQGCSLKFRCRLCVRPLVPFNRKKQQIHVFQVSVTHELERRTSVWSQSFPAFHTQTESKKVLKRKHSRDSEVIRFVIFIREVLGLDQRLKFTG